MSLRAGGKMWSVIFNFGGKRSEPFFYGGRLRTCKGDEDAERTVCHGADEEVEGLPVHGYRNTIVITFLPVKSPYPREAKAHLDLEKQVRPAHVNGGTRTCDPIQDDLHASRDDT